MKIRWGLLSLPHTFFTVVTFLLAQFYFIGNSFHPNVGTGLVGKEYTLANFAAVLTDSFYLKVFWRSALMAFLTVVCTMVISLPLAYFLARYRSKLAITGFYIIFLSSMTSHVIRALGWISLLSQDGPVNAMLTSFGLVKESIPFTGTGTLVGPVIGLTHYLVPYTVLLLIPVIQAVDPDLEQASYGMGASRLTTARWVVLPMILPGIIASSFLTFAMSISSFTTPALLGGQRLATITLMIYEKVMVLYDYATGAALALILLVLVLSLIYLTNIFTRGRMYKV